MKVEVVQGITSQFVSNFWKENGLGHGELGRDLFVRAVTLHPVTIHLP